MTDKRDSDRQVSRRSYLTAAAAGTAAFVAAGAGAASADEEYEVVEVPAGGTYRQELRDGDVLENVLIDISAQGAAYDIDARGSDWTIRNVGVRGAWDHAHPTSPIRVAADAGSTCRIENLYLGDGVIPDLPPSSNPTGIYAWWHHAGTIEIDRVNIQEHPDNGIYGSAPGNSNDHPNPGGGGQLHVTNSYVRAGKTAGIRLGTDGSYAENCVVWNNVHRGFWGYYNHTELIDCDLGGSPTDLHAGSRAWNAGHGATVTVDNCRFGSTNTARNGNEIIGSSVGEPEHRIPEGVPTSAEEAASGANVEPSDPDSSAREPNNIVVFDGRGNSDLTEYQFVVNDVVEPSTDEDATIDAEASVDGTRAEGVVANYLDAWRFDTEIQQLSVTGDATVRVNGVEVDPDDFDEVSTGTGDGDLSNVVVFDGREATTDTTAYEFVVDDAVEPSTDEDATIDAEASVDGNRAEGVVANYLDAWRFDTEIQQLSVTGDATVRVNGVEVDPDDFDDIDS